MKHNNMYTVCYRMNGTWEIEKSISVCASSKYDAYDKATYEIIPEIEAHMPYSVWVEGVTYQNGNYHRFNTCEGLPY